MRKLLNKVKVGDVLSSARWNELVDAINRAGLNLGQDSGLDAQFTPYGTALRLASRGGSDILRAAVTTAIPTGSIVAPSTSGRVTLYTWDGATSSASETGVTVLNDFDLASSVPIGATVKVAEIDGAYWLISAECW